MTIFKVKIKKIYTYYAHCRNLKNKTLTSPKIQYNLQYVLLTFRGHYQLLSIDNAVKVYNKQLEYDSLLFNASDMRN